MDHHSTPRRRKGRLAGIFVLLVVSLAVMLPTASAQSLKHDATPVQPTDVAGEAFGRPETSAEELGLIDANTYASPQFGNVVTWRDPWEADSSSMESSQADALDRVSVVTDVARFQAFFISAQGETASEYADRFIEYRTDDDPTIELVNSGNTGEVYWIAYSYAAEGDIAYDVVEISLVDAGSTLQVVEMLGWPEGFGEAFDDGMRDIEVDGRVPFVVIEGWPEGERSRHDECLECYAFTTGFA
jgi:hypothetical protein